MTNRFLFRSFEVLALSGLLTVPETSMADRLYFESVSIMKCATIEMPLILENNEEVYGFQLDMTLPDGLEFVMDGEEPDISLTARMAGDYNLTYNFRNDQTLSIATFSTSHTPVSGSDGAVAVFKITANDSFDGGAIVLRNIICTTKDNQDIKIDDEYCEIKGFIPVESVMVSQSSDVMKVGESLTLTATVFPEDATDKNVIWWSDNESVATVSEGGYVEAIKEGEATIFAIASNGISDFCRIRVEIVEVTSVKISNTDLTMIEGETFFLTAFANPDNATYNTLSWTSSDESVATVSDYGEVNAIKSGTATITASASNGVYASCVVTVNPKFVAVEGITISQSELNLTEGDTSMLTATITPVDATDQSLIWTSSDESVATVSAEGEVRAIKAGKATITVSSSNGLTAVCEVNVAAKIIEATNVILSAENIELKVGETVSLNATILPEDATEKTVVWTSSNEGVATVDINGNVTAIALGEATITATCGKVSTICNVTVVPTPVESITLNNSSLSLTEGESVVLTAIVSPSDATDQTLTWTSSDELVAIVSTEGMVTAIREGSTIITATASNGLTAECVVIVKANLISVTEITISNTELNLIEGEIANLTATVSPDDATDKTVTWTSSNESVSTVSAEGLVTAIKAGTATITASSSNGLSASCMVTVEPLVIEMEAIVLNAESLDLEVGDTFQLTAEIFPADTTYPDLDWWTDDETIAMVDQTGLVTMLREGDTTIHVRSVYWNEIEATCHINVLTDVEELIENNAPCDIYSTNGTLLKKDANPSEIENLSPGIYIIRQSHKTTKLLK